MPGFLQSKKEAEMPRVFFAFSGAHKAAFAFFTQHFNPPVFT